MKKNSLNIRLFFLYGKKSVDFCIILTNINKKVLWKFWKIYKNHLKLVIMVI